MKTRMHPGSNRGSEGLTGASLCLILTLGALDAAPARAQDLPSSPLSLANGRVIIGTDLSVSATPQDDQEGAWFNYTDYERNTLRLFRAGVTADVRIGERVSLLTEVRSENGGHVEAYALFVRVRPWRNRTLDIQAGRIPPTFGAFARRDYGGGNPLIGYPLAYQYLTSVRPDAIPATTDDVLRMRARGWRPSYPIGSLEFGPGLSLITAFRWDTGVQAAIGSERLRGTFAVTAGTMSDPRTRDTNDGKQLTGRVEWRPAPGFSLGGSAAHGPYVADAALSRVQLASDDVRSSQQAVGLDTELSRDYWLLRSELIWNRWQVPTIAHDLDAFSGFVEGLYKIRPGFFAAARLDRLAFSELPSATGARSWDAAVTRLEAGGGYYIRRNLVAKGTYQHNWRNGGLVRSRGLLAVQLHFWL